MYLEIAWQWQLAWTYVLVTLINSTMVNRSLDWPFNTRRQEVSYHHMTQEQVAIIT